jgi:hypothetical protein
MVWGYAGRQWLLAGGTVLRAMTHEVKESRLTQATFLASIEFENLGTEGRRLQAEEERRKTGKGFGSHWSVHALLEERPLHMPIHDSDVSPQSPMKPF